MPQWPRKNAKNPARPAATESGIARRSRLAGQNPQSPIRNPQSAIRNPRCPFVPPSTRRPQTGPPFPPLALDPRPSTLDFGCGSYRAAPLRIPVMVSYGKLRKVMEGYGNFPASARPCRAEARRRRNLSRRSQAKAELVAPKPGEGGTCRAEARRRRIPHFSLQPLAFSICLLPAGQTQSNPVKPCFSTAMTLTSHLAAPAPELNSIPPKAVPPNALSVSFALPLKNPASTCVSAGQFRFACCPAAPD